MKGNSTEALNERGPVLLLALGFTVSAVTVYALLSLVGSALLGDWRGGRGAWLLGGSVLGALFAVDLVRRNVPGAVGPSWGRQTPKSYLDRYRTEVAAVLWGLDAGLVVTTFRITSLSWGALVLAILGLVPWWAGVAYALGFALPLVVATLVVPRRTDPTGRTDPEPAWVIDGLFRATRRVPIVALTMIAGASVACLLTARSVW